jgi:hypothetical protein
MMPTAGMPLSIEDVETLLEAVRKRQHNFLSEPEDISWLLVLANIGDRWTSVTCIEGEWVGTKMDIPRTDRGVPTCPNGHPLTQSNTRLTIGWISMTED